MPRFEADEGAGLRIRLDDDEAELLRNLLAEMAQLLEAGPGSGDPVLERLFPRAYETAEDEQAYQEMVSGELQEHRLQTLETIATTLGQDGGVDETISPPDVEAWLAFLTDVRLAIGTRLGVDEERMGVEVHADDPDAAALSVLHWLGWLQEGILRRVMEDDGP